MMEINNNKGVIDLDVYLIPIRKVESNRRTHVPRRRSCSGILGMMYSDALMVTFQHEKKTRRGHRQQMLLSFDSFKFETQRMKTVNFENERGIFVERQRRVNLAVWAGEAVRAFALVAVQGLWFDKQRRADAALAARNSVTSRQEYGAVIPPKHALVGADAFVMGKEIDANSLIAGLSSAQVNLRATTFILETGVTFTGIGICQVFAVSIFTR